MTNFFFVIYTENISSSNYARWWGGE